MGTSPVFYMTFHVFFSTPRVSLTGLKELAETFVNYPSIISGVNKRSRNFY